MGIIETIKGDEKLKKFVIKLLSCKKHPRPRLWVKVFLNPFVHKRASGSLVRWRRVRLDVFPWKVFSLGKNSIIEDFAVINNGAGDVIIGDGSRVGIGSVVIGPVKIGNNVGIGQHVFISGFNHVYKVGEGIPEGKLLDKRPVVIEDDSHIGSNSVIVPGTHIGKWAIVGAGSVVTKDVPEYCLVAGNPAKIIKKYDFESCSWVKINK